MTLGMNFSCKGRLCAMGFFVFMQAQGQGLSTMMTEVCEDGKEGQQAGFLLQQQASKQGSKGRSENKPESRKSLSFNESLGLFDEDDATWKARKELHQTWMAKQAKMTAQMNDPTIKASTYWQYHWEPSFHCDMTDRIGLIGDGGKWICNPSTIRQAVKDGGSCLVYSIGSNGQFDFEQKVVEEISSECEIHIFDPGAPGEHEEVYKAEGDMYRPIEVWEKPPKQATYHQVAIGIDGTDLGFEGVPTKSISTMVRELGHEDRWIDIFKIDCEGCEWDVYQDFVKPGVKIRQLQAELHAFGYPRPSSNFSQIVDPFFHELNDAGFVVFSKEANLLSKGACVEYAFLKLDPSFSQTP
mmetsp:Transcript_12107/g.21498  ORF Transcript_12107/g.21498 Transcript_12107/m.21498 type:complete len:355 (-) Transcript_12107:158-1222(-)